MFAVLRYLRLFCPMAFTLADFRASAAFEFATGKFWTVLSSCLIEDSIAEMFFGC